jgi:hypothetical protein
VDLVNADSSTRMEMEAAARWGAASATSRVVGGGGNERGADIGKPRAAARWRRQRFDTRARGGGGGGRRGEAARRGRRRPTCRRAGQWFCRQTAGGQNHGVRRCPYPFFRGRDIAVIVMLSQVGLVPLEEAHVIERLVARSPRAREPQSLGRFPRSL